MSKTPLFLALIRDDSDKDRIGFSLTRKGVQTFQNISDLLGTIPKSKHNIDALENVHELAQTIHRIGLEIAASSKRHPADCIWISPDERSAIIYSSGATEEHQLFIWGWNDQEEEVLFLHPDFDIRAQVIDLPLWFSYRALKIAIGPEFSVI